MFWFVLSNKFSNNFLSKFYTTSNTNLLKLILKWPNLNLIKVKKWLALMNVLLNEPYKETTNYLILVWFRLGHEHAKYPFNNRLHHHHHLIIIFFIPIRFGLLLLFIYFFYLEEDLDLLWTDMCIYYYYCIIRRRKWYSLTDICILWKCN